MRDLAGGSDVLIAADKFGIVISPPGRLLDFGLLDAICLTEAAAEEQGAEEEEEAYADESPPNGYDLTGDRTAALGAKERSPLAQPQAAPAVRPAQAEATTVFFISVGNILPVPCTLESVTMLPPDQHGAAAAPPFTVHRAEDWSLPLGVVLLMPNQRLDLAVVCHPTEQAGYHAKWMVLSFVRQLQGSMGSSFNSMVHTFSIGLRLLAAVVDPTTRQLLSADAAPFVPQRDLQWFEQPVPFRAVHTTNHPFAHSMLHSHVAALAAGGPQGRFWDVFVAKAQARQQVLLNHHNDILTEAGMAPNKTALGQYVDRFRALLWLEECQMRWDVRQYDMHNVRLKVCGRGNPYAAVISVPGVTENRPRLVLGDVVLLRPSSWKVLKIFSGMSRDKAPLEVFAVVSNVNQQRSEVTLAFPNTSDLTSTVSGTSFAALTTMQSFYKHLLDETTRHNAVLWHVRFTYPRYGFGFMHQALDDVLRAAGEPHNQASLVCGLLPGRRASEAQRRPPRTYLLPEEGMLATAADLLEAASDARGPFSGAEENNGGKNGNGKKKKGAKKAKQQQLKWFDASTNELQRRAVLDINSGAMGSVPYIIYGPAGTGKTLTLIEAIRQELQRHPSVRILACAPSDAAADIVCSRLSSTLAPQEMMRLNWWQRMAASVPPALLRYCCIDEERQVFQPPPLAEATSKRVIVSTCGGAGLLHIINLPMGHFSAIFIDESSQALEPELLIPLGLAGRATKIVLAGDPRQLGATVRSPTARAFGLDLSLQERLMGRELYMRAVAGGGVVGGGAGGANGGGSGERRKSCITKLLANYRSHEVLLEIPRRLFYEGQLEKCASAETVDTMLKWELLPESRDFPLLFYGVDGRDMHDMDSPSFFNPYEASAIENIVRTLVSSKRVSVNTGDIGVVSAFRKQVLMLRKVLRKAGFGAINVGSVEDFQGQEAKVIIVSTVLSHRHTAEKDANLGFLNNPKRFNVALTRARALAICVGNPTLLLGEEYWRDLVHFCAENGAYCGCACPALDIRASGEGGDDADGLVDAVLKLSGTLGAAAADTMYPTDLGSFYREDPQWRVIL